MKGVRIMQKMLIRLDTEKIINEKKYALNNFHKTLHDFFDQFNFLQIQDSSDCIILEGKNHPHDFAHFGIIFNNHGLSIILRNGFYMTMMILMIPIFLTKKIFYKTLKSSSSQEVNFVP